MIRSWAEVSLSRLAWNLEQIRRRLLPGIGLIAVVKADAYGHGVEGLVPPLARTGVRHFAVATLEEGVQLRRLVEEATILVFGGCWPGQEKEFLHYRLRAAFFGEGSVPEGVQVELKVDTGMGRLGIPWDRVRDWLARATPAALCGVFTHLASAGTDPDYTRLQLRRFLEATQGLSCRRHAANSAGLAYREAHLDAVRPGLALYGIRPGPGFDDLRPLLSWKTRVLAVREVEEGAPIGYGGSFVTRRPSRIAVLPVGYADGYPRALSNRGLVRLRQHLVPVVGVISMDLTSVDVTDVPGTAPGDVVTLLEDDPQSPISAEALARQTGTIPYEILTGIGARVRRLWIPRQEEEGRRSAGGGKDTPFA